MDFEKPRQLLVIDSKQESSLVLNHLAEELGFQLAWKSNGIEALIWLEKGNIPDLILADSEMSLIPSAQFMQYLEASGFFCDIPVIAFANENNHEGLAAMVRLGANTHVYQPFDPAVLRDKIGRILHRQQVA